MLDAAVFIQFLAISDTVRRAELVWRALPCAASNNRVEKETLKRRSRSVYVRPECRPVVL